MMKVALQSHNSPVQCRAGNGCPILKNCRLSKVAAAEPIVSRVDLLSNATIGLLTAASTWALLPSLAMAEPEVISAAADVVVDQAPIAGFAAASSPIVAYLAFNVARNYNPRSKFFPDYLYMFAFTVVMLNLVTTLVFKQRIY